jgi:hypothetical protein
LIGDIQTSLLLLFYYPSFSRLFKKMMFFSPNFSATAKS